MSEWRERTGSKPRSISFTLLDIKQYNSEQYDFEQSDSREPIRAVTYSIKQDTLVVMIRGSLQVEAGDKKIELHQGDLLSLAASTGSIQIISTTNRPCTWYILSYAVYDTGDAGDPELKPNSAQSPSMSSHASFPSHQDVWNAPWQRLARGLEQLWKESWSSDPLQQVANHLHFQEWMMFILLERNFHHEQQQDSKTAVARAIEYMHAAFHEEITVEKLAREARISRRQFTELFRKLTNRSVTDYLTDLRIQEAKKLLLTGGPLSYIARTVGYRDEFYFNRRFKQIVGQSPRQYAQNKKRWQTSFTQVTTPMRIVADQYMGQLLKLGVTPVGVRTNMLKAEFMADEQKRSSSLQDIVDLGAGFPINLPHVSSLQPDLIVTQNEQQYQQFSQIAPTLLIPYQSADPLEKLRLISGVLNKTDTAEQWIEDYEWRIEQARTRLVSKLGRGCSVVNLLLIDGQLFVLGRYAGYGSFSLYQALQLQAPPKQQEELDETSLSMEIPVSALPDYAGDHIFISIYGDASLLIDSDTWRSLSAVQKGSVYFCNPYRFAFEDPYSLDEQLHVISACLL